MGDLNRNFSVEAGRSYGRSEFHDFFDGLTLKAKAVTLGKLNALEAAVSTPSATAYAVNATTQASSHTIDGAKVGDYVIVQELSWPPLSGVTFHGVVTVDNVVAIYGTNANASNDHSTRSGRNLRILVLQR
jgi:hypothetical protein